MLALACPLLAVWMGRHPLLLSAADLWVVSDPLTRADAIVLLGGNFQLRPLIAAEEPTGEVLPTKSWSHTHRRGRKRSWVPVRQTRNSTGLRFSR